MRREDAVLRQQHGIAAEHTSGEEKADSMEEQGEALPCSRRLFLKSRVCSKA